jgi:hypothetical protein
MTRATEFNRIICIERSDSRRRAAAPAEYKVLVSIKHQRVTDQCRPVRGERSFTYSESTPRATARATESNWIICIKRGDSRRRAAAPAKNNTQRTYYHSGDCLIPGEHRCGPCRHTHVNASPHPRSSHHTIGGSHKATRHAKPVVWG